jgi:signal transduction histidine kinase
MAVRAPSQVRIETLVARGRLALAIFALLAISLGLPGLPPTPAITTFTLGFLAYAGLLALLLRTRVGSSPHLPGATHAIDLTAYAAYVWLLGGPPLLALAWFLFALVAATLRWGWRGALTTGSVGIAVHVALGAQFSDLAHEGALRPQQFILIALLMGVMTMLVGLVGSYEDWRGTQLARLASWAGPDPNQPTTLPAEMLARTSEVLEAPRTLLIWEETDEPWTEVAIWDEGRIEQTREPPGSLGDVVQEHLTGSSFFCRDVRSHRPMTFVRGSRGLETWQGVPIDPRLRERFEIRALAAWPLRGDTFRGWLFCLDRPAFSLQDLVLGDVVADLASARLSQAYLVQKLRETVVTTERVRLARDLHDGVLQTLTGAALQLQAARRSVTLDPAAAEDRLSQVQRIIAAGQNDLRFFINQLGPQRATEFGGPVDLRGRVHELADRIRRQWGVPVTVATEPELLAIPDLLVSDLFLLIHEALVNAARHARASAIQLAILREAHQISIAVADDGQGFPFSGRYTLADLAREQIGPRTLRERVLSLGGTMQLETGEGGSRVRLTVPLAREVA